MNAEPGERPPVMPLLATKHTPAGARSFAVFYVRTIDWDLATLSGAYTSHYSAPHCGPCWRVVHRLNADRAARNHYFGGRITTRQVRLAPRATVARAQLLALVTFDMLSFELLTRSWRYLAADGAHHGYTFEVSLAWRDGWQVVNLAADR